MFKKNLKVLVSGFLVLVFSATAFAAIVGQKTDFMTEARSYADLLVECRQRTKDIQYKWNARGYGVGGANEFVAGDMTGTPFEGLSVAELTAVVTVANDFDTFINGGRSDILEMIRQ